MPQRLALSHLPLLLLAVSCHAQVADLQVVTRDLESTPDGFYTHDVLVDFRGRLFGQQLVVELDNGIIFQDALGGDTAPNENLYPFFPGLEADSYITLGGATRDTSHSTLIVGGTTELLNLSGPLQLDEGAINVAWAPSPGNVVVDQERFMIARLTLSDDADGRFWYYGNAAEQAVWMGPVPFKSGFFPIDLHVPVFPEPGSVLLALLSVCAGLASRRV